MSEEEVPEEVKEKKPGRFKTFLANAIDMLEEVPKALLGIGVLVSLLAGTINMVVTPEVDSTAQSQEAVNEVHLLQERLLVLETRSEILDKVILLKLMDGQCLLDNNNSGYEEIILELPSGKMIPVPRK